MENRAEKANECLLNWGRRVLFVYNRDSKNCPLYRVAKCPLFKDCLIMEVNGRRVGTFRELSVMLWVSAVEGCPLSRIPMYQEQL